MDVPRDYRKSRVVMEGLLTNVPYPKALFVMKGAERWLAASTK